MARAEGSCDRRLWHSGASMTAFSWPRPQKRDLSGAVVPETTPTVCPFRLLLVGAMGLTFHSSINSRIGFKVLGSFFALKSSNKWEF